MKTKASNTCNTACDTTDNVLKPCKQIFKMPGTAGKVVLKRKQDPITSPVQPCPLPLQSPVISGKFKLQLFPMDGSTKAILEQNNHNPYLELTITTQKKISSVVKHMTEKWRDTLDFSTGEILLFPYNAKADNLIGLKKWSLIDTHVTANDVYFMLNSPSVFRLRYGWFSKNQSGTNESAPPCPEEKDENLTDTNRPPFRVLNGEKESTSFSTAVNNAVETHQENAANKPASSISWFDSLSNISFGAILSEQGTNLASQQKNLNSLTCDSFDAAIGALMSRTNQKPANNPSIWDADETCHGFSLKSSDPPNLERADLRKENNKELLPKEGSNLLDKLDFSWQEWMVAPFDNASTKPIGGGTNIVSNSLDAFQNVSISEIKW